MRRMLDILRPQIEVKLKSWGTCIPESGNMIPGESLSEITVMIRSRFRAYVQAVIDKLIENVSILKEIDGLLCRIPLSLNSNVCVFFFHRRSCIVLQT